MRGRLKKKEKFSKIIKKFRYWPKKFTLLSVKLLFEQEF